MRPPSKKEAVGYDVVVWVDKDGDIVCRAFTPAGHEALRPLVNTYEKGDIVQIYCSPPEFEEEMPRHIRVGLLNSQSKKVVPMSKSPLH